MSSRKYTMPETSATFADRIKVLICKVGSVTEIARMCGFSEGVVRSWRDGNTDPSRARCVTLARTLGVSLVWLVAGEGAMQLDAAVSKAPDDQTSGETAQPDRHRSRLHAAASTLQTTGMAMDEERLNVALKMLQSELDLGAGNLSLADNADLLAELYSILGPGGRDVSPSAMMAFNRRLAERIRNVRTVAA
ncbi:transcriptional regulator [Fulvimonas sp. R45]|uniref:helix-turn-helix domain-containing protein n=1 Tax=Fulvimonas sp. R45 TaxID=3045937 RepID=UPI0026601459|nr:helix-turn-helix domain-containing protein [Fulvimonas sp. R45]MDO1530624.1 transcriptional regulator [Fulvimonas sp. R45]